MATDVTCLQNIVSPNNNYVPLFFFVGLVAGFLLMLILALLWGTFCVCRSCANGNTPCAPVLQEVVQTQESKAKEVLHGEKDLQRAYPVYGDPKANMDSLNPNETFLKILGRQSANAVQRGINQLDVLKAIELEEVLYRETERNYQKAFRLYIDSLVESKQLKPDIRDKIMTAHDKNIRSAEVDSGQKMNSDVAELRKLLLQQNRAKMISLRQSQEAKMNSVLRDFSTEQAKKEARAVLEKEFEMEMNNLVYELQLQEQIEIEELKRKYRWAFQERARQEEQKTFDQVTPMSQLTEEQFSRLRSNWLRSQERIRELRDADRSKQEALLEERLERHNILAKKKELAVGGELGLVRRILGNQEEVVRQLHEDTIISSEKSRQYMDQLRAAELKIREERAKQRMEAERILIAKLSQKKKEAMDKMVIEQARELAELDTELRNGRVRVSDPAELIEQEAKVRADQRQELIAREMQLDEEEGEEMVKLYRETATQVQQMAEDKRQQVVDAMLRDGVRKREMDRLMRQHQKDVTLLTQQLMSDWDRQDRECQDRLQMYRGNARKPRSVESGPDEQKMANYSQVSEYLLSQMDKDAVMKIQTANMAKLQNSLALTRLKQQRLTEQVLAEKRKKRIEDLQRKQAREATKSSQFEDRGRKDGKQAMDRLRSEAQQRIEALESEELTRVEEEEALMIRNQMTSGREVALETQRQELGQMVAKMQLTKAEQLYDLEQQRLALIAMETATVDLLSRENRQVRKDAEDKIKGHERDQEALIHQLDRHKLEQEEEANRRRIKLAEERKQSERKKSAVRQQQLSASTRGGRGRAATSSASEIVLQQLTLETERVQQEQVEREVNRTLQNELNEKKRQLEIKAEEESREQRLRLLAVVLSTVKLPRETVADLLHQLFPLWLTQEVEAILDKLLPPQKDKTAAPEVPDEKTVQELMEKATAFLKDPRISYIPPEQRPKSGMRPSSRGLPSAPPAASQVDYRGPAPVPYSAGYQRPALAPYEDVQVGGARPNSRGPRLPSGTSRFRASALPEESGEDEMDNRLGYGQPYNGGVGLDTTYPSSRANSARGARVQDDLPAIAGSRRQPLDEGYPGDYMGGGGARSARLQPLRSERSAVSGGSMLDNYPSVPPVSARGTRDLAQIPNSRRQPYDDDYAGEVGGSRSTRLQPLRNDRDTAPLGKSRLSSDDSFNVGRQMRGKSRYDDF